MFSLAFTLFIDLDLAGAAIVLPGPGFSHHESHLAKTAMLFLGTHDFSAFGSPTTPKGTTVRTVMKAEWMQAEQDEWQFEVQADAFLYRMVRRLVFVQVAVAQGKFSTEAIARSLAQQAKADPERSRRTRSEIPAGLAPAHGLTLVEVAYPLLESNGQ